MTQGTLWGDDDPEESDDLGGGASRNDDPDTSHRAGNNPNWAPGRNSMAFYVLTLHLLHEEDGITDDELKHMVKAWDRSDRKRRSELTRRGYLEDTGIQRLTGTGSDANVYRITQKGKDYIEKKNAGK